MARNLKTIAAASALVGFLLPAPALYAHGTEEGGMMQGGQEGMMGQGGMMNMMQQMSQMMERCNGMMASMEARDHGAARPNEPAPDKAPAEPGAGG